MKRSTLVLLIILGVLFIDQVLKIWVKTHMCLNEVIPFFGKDTGWARLHFTENKGMAFGMQLGGDWGKLLLSVFRIVAVGGIGYYLFKLVRDPKQSVGFLVCMALIFAGASGNIIDSAFYGLIFGPSGDFWHSSECVPAQLFPDGGGYAGFLHGSVVDMLHFPIARGTFPTWIPIWGGQPFEFFRPIFNIADASISIGVTILVIFHRRFFPSAKPEVTETPIVETPESTDLNG